MNKLNKFKVCLHKNKNYPVQEMINFNYGFNYYRPHKHLLNINESYHLIEGSMEIYILDDNCKVKKKIKLSAKRKILIIHQLYLRSINLYIILLYQ